MIRPHSLEELLFHMPTVERQAESTWAKSFAASVRKQSRRPRWKPSPKQEALMRRLVAELFDDSGPELIEEDDWAEEPPTAA